jgi:plasmid stabilization system protein ParE
VTSRLIVLPLAERDLEKAAKWYERQTQGLGARFLDSVDEVFRAIAGNPLQFSKASATARQALVRVFPYTVFFRLDGETVYVLACLHQRRKPSVWKRRARAEP